MLTSVINTTSKMSTQRPIKYFSVVLELRVRIVI